MDASLRAVTERLAAAGCVAAAAEAAELRDAAPDGVTVEAWLARREQGEPLAWITGRTVFCGLPLRVAPGVYVPRPHSEALARRATRRLPRGGRALDVCTGSGAVGAVMLTTNPTAFVVGTDIDARAAANAGRNRVLAVNCDLADGIGGDGTWDIVTAIAPYVPTDALRFLPSDVRAHEPLRALDGGADGLDHLRRVVRAGARLLRPAGHLLAELGGEQDEEIAAFASACGFAGIEVWHDGFGDRRGVDLTLGPGQR